MDLKKSSEEIKLLLEKRRNELNLTFIEDKHIYYMKDLKGKIRSDFPSVSKVIKKFHKPFDSAAKAAEMSKGDPEEEQRLITEWKQSGDISTNMGSRVHYELEKDLIGRYGDYKEVREPIFECGDEQIRKGDNMIVAGKQYIDLMHERGAVLLDTEIVLGDNNLGYTGQPDKMWLMENREKTNIGIVTTDWKGLPINTPILTNNGWKTMGTLTIDDLVFDMDGNLVKINNISSIKNKKCLKFIFDNNEEMVSDFEHRWLVFTLHNGKKTNMVMTTQEIKEYYEKLNKKTSYKILKIENCKPLKLDEKKLPIDPYLLGVWLGDGHSRCGMITQANENVWNEIKRRGYSIGNDVSGGSSGKAQSRTIFNLRGKLRKLNLLKNKHLPESFLLSSYEQRLDILRGLMDSDGYYNKSRNRFSISTTKKFQVKFSVEILSSLGIKTTIIRYYKTFNNKKIECFNIEFTTNKFNPFLCRNQNIEIKVKADKNTSRIIKSVIDTESVPTKCVEVNSPSSTFLCGIELIVTHNTNQIKNFTPQWYNKYLYPPFNDYRDYALTHYYLQIPLYNRLLREMLVGTEYEKIEIMGGLIVLLKEDGTFQEYRVPKDINDKILTMDLSKYTKK